MFNTKKKAFTLIEMLIVIVIIGILAAALVPKLVGIQGKARWSARQGDLNQIGTALTAYYNDFWEYPDTGAHPLSDFETQLNQFLSSIPTDPLPNSTVEWIGPSVWPAGQYMFTTIKKNDIPDTAFAMWATQESYGRSANYVIEVSSWDWSIDDTSEFFDIDFCPFVTNNGAYNAGWDLCQTLAAVDLRYIYKN